MDEQVIKKLNQINQDFYQKIAADFSKTRQQPWEGWKRCLPVIEENFEKGSQVVVLDVGCGNGRFGHFLSENLSQKIEYFGVDNNAKLLEEAKITLSQTLSPEKIHLVEGNVVEKTPLISANLVCLFGVLHHIPSFQKRVELLQTLAKNVKSGGLLIFTAWQFDEIPNMLERSISFAEAGIRPEEIEENDYLLTWERGTHAVRYCHLIKDVEIEKLIAETGLKIRDQFFADGKNQLTNHYIILQKM